MHVSSGEISTVRQILDKAYPKSVHLDELKKRTCLVPEIIEEVIRWLGEEVHKDKSVYTLVKPPDVVMATMNCPYCAKTVYQKKRISDYGGCEHLVQCSVSGSGNLVSEGDTVTFCFETTLAEERPVKATPMPEIITE